MYADYLSFERASARISTSLNESVDGNRYYVVYRTIVAFPPSRLTTLSSMNNARAQGLNVAAHKHVD